MNKSKFDNIAGHNMLVENYSGLVHCKGGEDEPLKCWLTSNKSFTEHRMVIMNQFFSHQNSLIRPSVKFLGERENSILRYRFFKKNAWKIPILENC